MFVAAVKQEGGQWQRDVLNNRWFEKPQAGPNQPIGLDLFG